MNETIKLILSLSLSGSILAGLIFAIKPFIKHKLSKSIQYYIWIVVLLRLVLPFSFENSIMNKVFYNNQTSAVISSQGEYDEEPSISQNISNVSSLSNIKEDVVNRIYDGDVDHSRFYRDSFNKYIFYIWLLGAIFMILSNLTSYVRFTKKIKLTNKLTTDEENRVLNDLLDGRHNVVLSRNVWAPTPMLIGILRPAIIIPDISFDENQLKYILLHELTHFKRFDIAIKWLIMLVTSLHWFNPFMYFIKKEINHACELACDETVIKNLNSLEKQAYGDTLISIVSKKKYSVGILQATMSEDKSILKERLISIMKYSKKSKTIIVTSVILFVGIISSSIILGAGVGPSKEKVRSELYTQNAQKKSSYNLAEISRYKTPYVGDNSKVYAIVNHLPVPDNYFNQKYISMKTSEKPYNLTLYYESGSDIEYKGEWPVTKPDSAIELNSEKNALVLFSMIDNLDEVTFAYRISQSSGELDFSKYDTTFTFKRAHFEEKYGNLSAFGKDLDLFKDVLAEKISTMSE
ncbi:M56 family metallopeptidase [Alkaliphilus sp. B6464]|uniref:M56 family metallopeptidase n=1 Tax=Alkaliphilus sp. B6464 TaxID=2731219 RepID=UPI001BAC81D5|nr:M56 family metallopeptidase [Alkaliphilus sp. B6464]QUH20595.1 DUF4825 domain-containing protein [Alkaliphilus sp. B6464]